MSSTRREFLSAAAGSAAAIGMVPAIPQLFLQASQDASAANENVLVVVQLSGGNDGLNTVVPWSDDDYYKNRYSLGIGKNAALKIDDRISFNPSMSGFSKLLEDGELSVIQGVGYPNPNRSHFESMDLWHTAHLPQSSIPTGWLGKYLESNASDKDVAGIHLGADDQPLALAAPEFRVPSIRSLESFRYKLNENANMKRNITKLVSESREDDSLLSFLQDSTESALKTSHHVEQVLGKYKSSQDYPALPLGNKLKTVAQLIGAGMQTSIYYVTLDGFDTHANQEQAHNGLVGQVSDSISAFINDMREQKNLDRVTLMVFSEFGRRVKQNASSGTDHGAAAPMFLAGGRIKPGVIGKHPSLTDLDDGDLKFSIDYRSVYATLLDRWLQVDASKILGGKFESLDLFA